MSQLTQLRQRLHSFIQKDKAVFLPKFFKTGKGEYAEGDTFIGVVVPDSRKVAKEFKDLSFEDIEKLLISPIHEERLVALLILVERYKKADEKQKKDIYEFYLAHTKYINNWDLVDLSASYIVGSYLVEFSTITESIAVLLPLAHSQHLWTRRIVIIATFAFIYKKESRPTFAIAEVLLRDSHDLIQKAVGWMLREVGKRISQEEEEKFLKKQYKTMPRTMLRYAIERFPESLRKKYLMGEV